MDFTGGITFTGGMVVTVQPPPSYKAIFGYGYISGGSKISVSNLVSNTGVVATDTAGVGTTRALYGAASYGGDKAIFGYGNTANAGQSAAIVSITNLISNTGVVGNDVTGVGTVKYSVAAAGYGTDKAIFGYGIDSVTYTAGTNKVSNTGVVATDTAGVGTARYGLAAASYGSGQAIFGYGDGPTPAHYSITNKVSDTGVVATDTAGVGTARVYPAATGYGTDKAMFGYGCSFSPSFSNLSMTNLVSNTGVVATDTAGVGTARNALSAAGYGSSGQALFGYGVTAGPVTSITNLVSNTGVVATDTTGVGTARYLLSASSYGS